MMTGGHTNQFQLTLGALLTGLVDLSPEADRTLTGLTLDSREVQPGDLFLACHGRQVDGGAFIDAAIENGAVAVVWESRPGALAIPLAWRRNAKGGPIPVIALENLSQQVGVIADRFYGHPSRALFMTGVTGTNGKTSVSQFLAHSLSPDAPCGIIGTLGHGLYRQLQESSHTTPDAVTVQRWLADLREHGAASVVMEVSSHALDQGRVNGVAFNCAVFTNLSREHLDYHGDMQSYAKAKASLFSSPGLQYAAINVDDAAGRELAASLPDSITQLRYGLDASHSPDVLGRRVSLTPDGIDVDVTTPAGEGSFQARVLGRFNASNLLAVLAVLLMHGIPLKAALARLGSVRPVPGRMETFGGGEKPLVVVDYAHTPDALEQALRALREHGPVCLWCVFGCGGDRDAGKRPEMGAIAERLADVVILANDNPRSEDPQAIIDAIRHGMTQPEQVHSIPDRHAAINDAIGRARPGDIVLVAGKGHEAWQIIGSEKRPFSDRDVVLDCLDAWT
ncbi:MAG: UDP-N-acetylmuramoyl-L-alanyl-D-glutamate--2,6-diaminopimelate ligase [Proteobacteria bacterium]|nr:UDP-N-acetylmuramoyl-L-alanyl-D-glutamate--2,6-diaminopimelate ligase [Pseudomonadota bacterium]